MNGTEVEIKDTKADIFVFSKALEQIKDVDLSLMRPEKPLGNAPHLSFIVELINQEVEGYGGPYRQFF